MTRREVLQMGALGAAQGIVGSTSADTGQVQPAESASSLPTTSPAATFEWHETSITELQEAMQAGRATAASLAEQFLQRIAEMDKSGPALNAVIEINPEVMTIARTLDEERKVGVPRGPLHGIPILVKDNLDTHDRMSTTAGSLAMLGALPERDSFVVHRLRQAGALILGKTNLSEWANFRSSSSTSGWSGRGGLTRNPYALDRNPSGSSSGSAVAVAASLCAASIGTETDGSIISPASVCGIVGLKPTLGLVSREGIIPIAHSQDTAGPMARSVKDAAILLGAIAGVDPRDMATEPSRGKTYQDYTQFLDAGGLSGARIGVARKLFLVNKKTRQVIESALDAMKQHGAVIIDPVEVPDEEAFGNAETEVLLYEFKADLNAYLASLEVSPPVHSLAEIIAFNERNADKEMPFFGQELLVRAQSKGGLGEKAYLDALEKCGRVARAEGLDLAMEKHHLDAIVAPSNGPAVKTDLVYGDRGLGGTSTLAAVAGYPSITVPAGSVSGLPVAISFTGRAWSEPTLLKLAYAFEQATKARRAPDFAPTVG